MDLDVNEIIELWNRFEERRLELGNTVDASMMTLHDAFLVGVVFGREQLNKVR